LEVEVEDGTTSNEWDGFKDGEDELIEGAIKGDWRPKCDGRANGVDMDGGEGLHVGK